MSKKQIILLFFSFFLFQKNNIAQTRYVSDDPKYVTNVEAAAKAYEEGNYKLCAACYEKAFEVTTKSQLSLFRAARCYSLAKKAKKAHYWLDKSLVDNEESVSMWLAADGDKFDYLKKKKKCWKKINQKLEAYESTINTALRDELLKMREEDQKYRMQMQEVENGSDEMAALWEKQEAVDEKNIKRVEEIISEHGYPGKSIVGSQAMDATFLIIQHADLSYQEKYLPLLQEAADKGEMRKSALALLIDRINMRNDKPQIYGSQLRPDPFSGELWFHEIEDEANVDKRRAEMGLGPLSEYAKFFELEYPRKAYEKDHLKKLLGAWDLKKIYYPKTKEEIIPTKSYIATFYTDGTLKYNKEVNTCQTKFRMSLDRKVIFSPLDSCTEKCCDKDISNKLQYFKATGYDLTGEILVLRSAEVVFVFNKKVNERIKSTKGEKRG